VFRLQSSWLTMQAEKALCFSEISPRLYNFYLVKCDNARKFAWAGPFRNVVRVGLDCSRGMEHTVQVLAAHCVLKQSSENELFDTPAFLHAVANAWGGQVNPTSMQVFFGLSYHGHFFCVVFTCGLLQVILARTAPFDESSFFLSF